MKKQHSRDITLDPESPILKLHPDQLEFISIGRGYEVVVKAGKASVDAKYKNNFESIATAMITKGLGMKNDN